MYYILLKSFYEKEHLTLGIDNNYIHKFEDNIE
jgi:hypothetical protein